MQRPYDFTLSELGKEGTLGCVPREQFMGHKDCKLRGDSQGLEQYKGCNYGNTVAWDVSGSVTTPEACWELCVGWKAGDYPNGNCCQWRGQTSNKCYLQENGQIGGRTYDWGAMFGTDCAFLEPLQPGHARKLPRLSVAGADLSDGKWHHLAVQSVQIAILHTPG